MAIPVHRCVDLDRALKFYVDVLGAKLEFREGPYSGVKWNEHRFHVSQNSGDGALGAATVVDVDDVDAVFTALTRNGYVAPTDRGPVFLGPTDQTWGNREWYVADPDGNVLRFTRW
ncbi:MAG: VOC family protein [Archangium sp.]|nr:VOC family protein [Archangium sp.]